MVWNLYLGKIKCAEILQMIMMLTPLLLELEQFDAGLFKKILADQDFTDVTLVTEDGITISAHRLVLSASSDFFQQVFKRNPNPKTIIYVDNVSHVVLEGLVHFIYTGQVRIEKSGLKKFLEMGEKLKISGLNDDNVTNEVEYNADMLDTEENITL